MFKFIKKDLEILDKYSIVYKTTNLCIKTDANGKPIRNSSDRVKKQFVDNKRDVFKYKYINGNLPVKKTEIKKTNNASCILLGKYYNGLIGIDIDDKGDTMDYYDYLCEENEHDRKTLTVSTPNNGLHEYYYLNEEQQKKLDKFQAKTGHHINGQEYNIDVKYTNQIFFGPACMKDGDGILYKYKIIVDKKPQQIPDFLFNIIYDNYVTHQSNNKKVKRISKTNNNNNNKNTICNKINFNENDKRLIPYLDCINVDTLSNYDDWFTIGCIIFNEKGSIHLFKYYSSKANNYDENSCIDKWNSMNEERESMATIKRLYELAKSDNEKQFYKTINKDKIHILKEIFNKGINDYNVSLLFYALFPQKYIYDKETSLMYCISQYGIWNLDEEYFNIYDDINRHLFTEIEDYYFKLVKSTNNEDNKDKYITIYQQCRKYIRKNRNKKIIIDEVKVLYRKNKMVNKWNNVNDKLVAFKNGVYNIDSGEFRIAEPEEYISVTTEYKYKKADSDTKNLVLNILKDIQPNKDDLTYLLKMISNGLIGSCVVEEFYFWLGNSRNGKGVLRDMVKYTLGDYYNKIDIKYLIKSGSYAKANDADPTILENINSRILISDEAKSGVPLQEGKIKSLSGNDDIKCRALYAKNIITYRPKFNIIIQTNNEPVFDGTDPGIVSRFRLIPFPIKFVNNPIGPNQKKADNQIKNKIKNINYRLAFFEILVEHYKLFKENGLEASTNVKEATTKYLNEMNPVKAFIDEKLIITNSNKDYMKSSELYNEFKTFNNKNIVVTPSKFKTIMIENGIMFKKTKYGNRYIGIKYNDEGEEDESLFINN